MTTNELALPRFRRDQFNIIQHPAKTKVIAMGRRWGKTVMGGAAALGTAAAGGRVAWAVPTYKNSRPIWRWSTQMTAMLAKKRVAMLNKNDRMITFSSGGFLGIYSMDNPDSIRGESFNLVVVDEAGFISPEAYFDAILPTLADYDGDCLLIGTPKGKNWFWQEWARAKADGIQSAAWQAPTSANPMPSIQRAFQLVQGRIPERSFRQEWLAEFLDDGGGVFRNVRACATAQKLTAPIAGRQYIVGVDLAKHNDFTWFVVGDVLTKEVVYLDYFNQIDYTVQLDRLSALFAIWKPQAIIVERNIGEMFIESAHRRNLPVIPFQTTNATKQVIIDNLAMGFEQKLLKIPDDEMLIGELQAFEIDKTPSGLIKYGAPDGFHDDGVIALALWWYYAAQMSESRSWVG